MLMARDTARDEAQKLHRKWLKHQAFMAELARNKEWLAKIEQVSGCDQGMERVVWGGQIGRAGGSGGRCHAKDNTWLRNSVNGGCGASNME